MENEKISYQMDDEKLIIERNSDEEYRNEVFVYVKRNDGSKQDILCIRKNDDGTYCALISNTNNEFENETVTVPVKAE